MNRTLRVTTDSAVATTAVAGGRVSGCGVGLRLLDPHLPRHQDLPDSLDLFPELEQGDNAGAVLLAAQEYPLAEDVDRHDLFRADRGLERFAFLGEALPRLHVELVLVLEAAEEPAAAAGDLGGIEREVLVLREREVDRRQLGEPGGAAVFPPAAAHAA